MFLTILPWQPLLFWISICASSIGKTLNFNFPALYLWLLINISSFGKLLNISFRISSLLSRTRPSPRISLLLSTSISSGLVIRKRLVVCSSTPSCKAVQVDQRFLMSIKSRYNKTLARAGWGSIAKAHIVTM